MVHKFFATLLGSMLIGIGMNGFLVPFEMLDGGMMGIGLLVKYILGFKAGFAIIVLSIPLYIIAWKYYRNYFYNSLQGMLISSVFIDLFAGLEDEFTLPALYSSIIGGILIGFGIGIMLRYNVSTGGTDLLAQFLSDTTSLNVGILIFLIDATVILVASQFISQNALVLSAITVTVVGICTGLCTLQNNLK
ncbi:hypothetical protein D1872_209590 [compost metagenome]